MDIADELIKCKTAITQSRKTIEKLMFSLVRMYGGEIKSPTNRIYQAVEPATGLLCQVESFIIEDGKLNVKVSFDGDSSEQSVSDFHSEELVDGMQLMISGMKEALLSKMEKAYSDYMKDNIQEPRYANCQVTYKDDGTQLDVAIKLSLDVDEAEDDKIFYSLKGFSDLKYFLIPGAEDFIVTDFYHLEEDLY